VFIEVVDGQQRSAVPTIKCQNVLPLVWHGNEAGAYWVHPDVIRFFIEAFVVPKAVIEEITLPNNTVMCRLILFPRANDSCHLLMLRKAEQGMEMIWHENKQMDKPAALLVKKQR